MKRFFTLTFGVLGLASVAMAQSPAQPSEVNSQPQSEESMLPEIVVNAERETIYKTEAPKSVTRLHEAILDSARSVQVVTSDVLQDRGIVNPQDAIQTVSGVHRSAYNTGSGETYFVRGFRQQNLLKDGFRAGMLNGANGFFLSPGPATDISNLHSIEVLKGPAAVEFGRGEPGGFVSYVTRDAEFTDSFSIHQQIGSFDFLRSQVNANWAALPEVLALRFDAGYEQNGSFIDYMEGERLFLSTALRWQASDRTTLTFKAEYNHNDSINSPGMPYLNGGVIKGVPHDRFFGETDFANLLTDTFRGLLKLEHQWNDEHKTTLAVHGVQSDQEGGYFILFNFAGGPLQDPVTGDIARAAAGVDFREQNFTVRLDHQYTAQITDAIQNDLLISVEYDYQRNENHRRLYTHAGLNPYDPVYNGFNPGPLFGAFPLHDFYDIKASSWSVMLMDRLNLHEKVFLTFGARVEWFSASNVTTYSPSGLLAASDTAFNDVYFNPSVGLVYKPLSNVSLYANYAQSTYSLHNVSKRTFSGEALDPERSSQLEFGTKGEFFDGRLATSLAFFQIDKENVAATDPSNPLFSINSGEERSQGIEFDLAGEITKGWNVILNYAYIDCRTRNSPAAGLSGNRRYGVPENSGGLFTTYEFQEGSLKGLGIGGGMFFSDRVTAAPGNAGSLPGYAQTDALVYYKLGKARFQLNVKNVFDNEYYIAQGINTMVQAAPGRTFLASVRFEF